MGKLFLLGFCFLIHLPIFAKDLLQESDSKQKNVNESNNGQTNETINGHGTPLKVNLTEMNETLYERKPSSSSCFKSFSLIESGKTFLGPFLNDVTL